METGVTNYSFRVSHAQKYGLEEAVIIYHFQFWIEKNAANKINVREGNVWTYNSARAFSEIFPFWNKHKVRRVLDSLIKQKVVVKGNYNKAGYDRTSWFAFVEPASFCRIAKCMLQNCQMHVAELPNAFDESATPIPDTLPYSNKHIVNKDKKAVPLKAEPSTEGILHQHLMELYADYVEKRTGVKAKITAADAKSLKNIRQYLLKQCEDDPEKVKLSWKVILDNLHLCEKFYQTNFQLTALNKNLVQIIDQIRNGTSQNKQQHRANALNEFNM
jgi:hypothetical protein